MKKVIVAAIAVLVLILASCSLNMSITGVEDKGSASNEVVYGKLNGYEILEHRILIGYEDRNAVDEIVEKLGGEVYLEIPQINVVAVKIPMKVEDAFKKLKSMKISGIKYVEPSYKRDLIDPKPGKVESEGLKRSIDTAINEEFWDELWGLKMINAPLAWEEATGVGVTVAVVDTPIDCQHPDLIGQCVTGYDPGDLTHEATEIPPDSDYEDPLNPEDDHGTHVAGTIAAKKDEQGVVGLAYGAKIMPILIFRGTEDHSSYYYVGDEFVANGIIWAVDHGAKVLSNSWGGGGYSYTLKAAVDYALSHNAVFVAAAGNGHTDQHWHYPSAYPGVIAVAASTARDEVVDFSNRSDYISVAAPGVNILSSVPHLAGYGVYGKPYDFWAGTSMATPHVSALVALLLQKYPDATPYQIRKMIEESADDIEEPGWDHAAGYGRINAAAALNENPSDYSGATYHVEVVSKDAGFGIPAALVTLKRKSGVGSDYYAATDENGVASFYGIDPDEYEVIVGGPDLFEISSPILRMEESTGTNYSTSLSAGEATDTVEFDTNIILEVEMAQASDSIHLVSPFDYYAFDELVDLTSPQIAESSGEILGWIIPAGQVLLMYEASGVVESELTVSGTAIINGYEIPISGVISPGATWTFMDEYGGGGYWYTAF
jgi:subtilisin family serine protease